MSCGHERYGIICCTKHMVKKIERLNVFSIKLQDKLPDIGRKAVLILVNRVQNLVLKINEV